MILRIPGVFKVESMISISQLWIMLGLKFINTVHLTSINKWCQYCFA